MQRAFASLVPLVVVCVGAAARAQQPVLDATETTDPLAGSQFLQRSSLILAVLERNPTLEAAREAAVAAEQRVPQVTSLDDPTATYALAPLSIASSDSRFGEVLALGQRLPFPGTLRLRGDEARATAAAAGRRVEVVRLRLAATASILYDRYWLVDQSLDITTRHVDLVKSFQEAATSRYATGKAPQLAPLQAEVEAAHLLHRQVELRTARRKVVAQLNALLHRPASAPLPPPPRDLEVDLGQLEDGESRGRSRPELAEQRARNEALAATVGLARQTLKPDFQATTSYNSMWGTTEHRWAVGVGLRVPLWRRQHRAAIAEAAAKLAHGKSELAALSTAIDAEVEAALASLDEARHVESLYRNRLLPAARDQVAAARSQFETGQGTMLGLIDAQRSLLSAELSYQEALAGVSTARAEVDRALGRMPFEPTLPAGSTSPVPELDEDQP